MDLIVIAFAITQAILPSAPNPSEADVITRASVEAVRLDAEEPITASRAGDLALLLRFARDESDMRITRNGTCILGDHGLAAGPWQLQHTPRELACSPAEAARIWLRMAHDSVRRCRHLDPDARLAALASGNCQHGRTVSRERMRAARIALAKVGVGP